MALRPFACQTDKSKIIIMYRIKAAGLTSGSPVGRQLFGDREKSWSAVGKRLFGEGAGTMEHYQFSQSMRDRPFRLDRTTRTWDAERPNLGPEEIGAVRHGIYSPRMVGDIPNPQAPICQEAVPGYTGYIPRKIPENIFIDRFKIANERARTIDQEKANFPKPTDPGLQAIPRVPGYMGYIPGAYPESVHALINMKSNEHAQTLRRDNPMMRSDSWLNSKDRGPECLSRVDLAMLGSRSTRVDIQSWFSDAQVESARKKIVLEGAKRGMGLGHPRPPKKPDRVHNDEPRFLDRLWTHKQGFRPEAHLCPDAGHKAHFGQGESMRSHNHNTMMAGPA